MRKLNIAIVGLGNIGSYLYKYLNDNKKILTKKNNCLPFIRYVSARNKKRKRNIKIKKNQWLNNYLDATIIKDIDLIVELIGGSEGPAKKLVFNALKNKKHVVTANKALIAQAADHRAREGPGLCTRPPGLGVPAGHIRNTSPSQACSCLDIVFMNSVSLSFPIGDLGNPWGLDILGDYPIEMRVLRRPPAKQSHVHGILIS